jgi:hypothetical protein
MKKFNKQLFNSLMIFANIFLFVNIEKDKTDHYTITGNKISGLNFINPFFYLWLLLAGILLFWVLLTSLFYKL